MSSTLDSALLRDADPAISAYNEMVWHLQQVQERIMTAYLSADTEPHPSFAHCRRQPEPQSH